MGDSFIVPGARVFFLATECEEEPVREGTVEAVYDDGSVDIWDDYLGSMCVDITDVFETREDAEDTLYYS